MIPDKYRTRQGIDMSLKRILLWMLLAINCLGMVAAAAERMQIEILEPDFLKEMNGNTSRYILLSGPIDVDAPQRLAEVLDDPKNHYADVYIHSPGGVVLAAIELGRMLRKAKTNTYIGTGSLQRDTDMGVLFFKPAIGRCFSACALTFLGGEYRWLLAGSEYGVHRFWKDSTHTNDLAFAQIISANIGAYIRDMGVSGELFDLMANTSSSEMLIVPEQELEELNVVNNGRKPPVWSIEAAQGANYLRGEQDSVFGKGKLLFMCDPDSGLIYMTSIYEAGQERAHQIAKGGWVHSLMNDGEVIPLDSVLEQTITGANLNTIFSLSQQDAKNIASSTTIGHAMQTNRTADTFVGFRIDIADKQSARRVSNFLNTCAGSGP